MGTLGPTRAGLPGLKTPALVAAMASTVHPSMRVWSSADRGTAVDSRVRSRFRYILLFARDQFFTNQGEVSKSSNNPTPKKVKHVALAKHLVLFDQQKTA